MHWQAALRQGIPGAIERLQGPPLPDGGEHLWRWYCQLLEAAPVNGMGPAVLTYGQIRDWVALNQVRPTPFELECLFALDRKRLEIRNTT